MSIEVEEGSAVWAYAQLLDGKKLRIPGWNNGVFIEMNECGVFKNHIGDEWCHSDLRAGEKWELYEEPKHKPAERLLEIGVDHCKQLTILGWEDDFTSATAAMDDIRFGGYVHEFNGQKVETGCFLWVWFNGRGEWSARPHGNYNHRSHAKWVQMIEVTK